MNNMFLKIKFLITKFFIDDEDDNEYSIKEYEISWLDIERGVWI